jgi:ParB family chromosome partitioning protein
MKQRKLVDGPGTRPGIPMPAYSNEPKPPLAANSSGEETPVADFNALVNLDIRLLDDSPDQYRLVYPKDEIEELAMLLKAGQTTPIRVRPKANGRFEIITGHRRTRAAPIAGLTHLLAMVVEVDDVRAAIELMVDNEAQEGVGDFERAKGYQTLVNKGLTQNEVAEAMGINKSLVSKRLSFLKLPSPVIEALATYPRAYSWNTVEKILPLLNETPELTQFAAEGTHRVGTGEWSHQTFIAQMYQQQKKQTPSTDPKTSSGFAITDSESRPILTMKSKPKGRVEIQLASDVDQAVFMTRLNQMLRDEASKPDSDLRRQEQRSR